MNNYCTSEWINKQAHSKQEHIFSLLLLTHFNLHYWYFNINSEPALQRSHSYKSFSLVLWSSSPHVLYDWVAHSPLSFTCSFLAFQPNYGDQSGMGMMSSGLGLGYDRGQFTSGHGPPHGMLRQKSIGEAVCFFCLPLLSACLSVLWTSPGLHCADLFVCGQQCLVCGQTCAHFVSVSVADHMLYNHLFYLLFLYTKNKMFVLYSPY